MKISKYINIDENILIEYIHDDSNLIGEPYNILYNTQTGVKSFISSDEPRPSTSGLKQTNNDLYNQLYRVNLVQNRYSSIPLSTFPNKINTELTPFLQVRNFAASIPIRYDIIRVHIPIDYVFEGKKGFYIRVYTYNFDNTKEVELSNFAFDMSDVEQSFQLEYSAPILYLNSRQWGKYVNIQIPSVTKVSDQRLRNLPRANSINFNLSPAGVGLSKTSPVFIDFHYIERINQVNQSNFFDLSPRKTVVVPQTPEFEKLGVNIEESTQGDFFLIYGTYNGSLGDFETFIEDQYFEGNRYYLEFKVEIFERNVLVKTTTFIVKEDFGEEIEYRPILKYTTTTAVIDVTMKLINSVDATFIERKASFGFLQGGGAKMGSEPNPRLNIANGSGGAGDIAKYARYLRKINLLKSKKQDVFYIKSSQLADTASTGNAKGVLNFRKIPFILFSFNYYLLDDDTNFRVNGINYLANNKSLLYITPFDDFIKVKIIKTNYFEEIFFNLETFSNIKLTIRSDQKTINFDIYKDSADNVYSEGRLVFKIPQEKFADIKIIYNQGFNNFYINGVDTNGIKKIIYTSFFMPWDVPDNLNKLLQNYDLDQINRRTILQTSQIPADPTIEVINAIDSGENIDTTVNTEPVSVADTVSQQTDSSQFNPRWKSPLQALEVAFGNRNTFTMPLRRDLLIVVSEIPELGITPESKSKQFETLEKSEIMATSMKTINDRKLDLIIGYFKGLNLNPITFVEYWFLRDDQNVSKQSTPSQRDLLFYINTGLNQMTSDMGMGLPENEVQIGEFVPNSEQLKFLKSQANPKNKDMNIKNLNMDQVVSQSKMGKSVVANEDKKEIFYSPDQIPASGYALRNPQFNITGAAGRGGNRRKT
jgi:hypothetical protein